MYVKKQTACDETVMKLWRKRDETVMKLWWNCAQTTTSATHLIFIVCGGKSWGAITIRTLWLYAKFECCFVVAKLRANSYIDCSKYLCTWWYSSHCNKNTSSNYLHSKHNNRNSLHHTLRHQMWPGLFPSSWMLQDLFHKLILQRLDSKSKTNGTQMQHRSLKLSKLLIALSAHVSGPQDWICSCQGRL